MPTYDHRSAGHDFDWDAMTQEDAIEILLGRMADMFEVLNGDRPPRPEGVPLHHLAVRWSPIISDYALFARRANKASEEARKAKERAEEEIAEARSKMHSARDERSKAVRTLQGLKTNLRDALAILDREEG